MPSADKLLITESSGDTLILVPAADMREFEYLRMLEEAERLLASFRAGTQKNVVVDLERTSYFGSTALEIFVRFWKAVCEFGGRMAMCNAGVNEQQILHLTKLDTLWDVCETREEALRQVDRPADVDDDPDGDLDDGPDDDD